jgi:hypothetical protein
MANSESRKKQRLSMFRSYTVADLFTLGNASSGTIAIFLPGVAFVRPALAQDR